MPQFDLSDAELSSYRSQVRPPEDLAEFWKGTLAQARSVAWAPKVELIDTGLRVVDTYDVTFSGYAGEPVKAWLRIPAATTGDLPIVVRYVGYRGGRGLSHQVSHHALAGYACLDVDNRGQGAGSGYIGDTADSAGSEPSVPGFMTKGVLHRDTYYYRRLFTDAVLAVDAARQLPGVDGRRVAVTGTSQGGGLALAVAGLVPDLTAVMADVPFLSDMFHGAQVAGRGPYTELATYLASQRQHHDRVYDVLANFDVTVHVPQATAPALFSVALMDQTCPPSTVFAAFHAYAGPKEIRRYPFNDHEGGQFHQEVEQLRWLPTVMPLP